MIDLQLLVRFKVSIDGSPRPDNHFMRRWLPFALQEPLVLQVVLFTTACFLNEAGRFPKVMVLNYKNLIHQTLNQYLESPELQVGDSAILAVSQLLMAAWYWGGTGDVRVHMKGLKTMILMRGGAQEVGLDGYIMKSSFASVSPHQHLRTCHCCSSNKPS